MKTVQNIAWKTHWFAAILVTPCPVSKRPKKSVTMVCTVEVIFDPGHMIIVRPFINKSKWDFFGFLFGSTYVRGQAIVRPNIEHEANDNFLSLVSGWERERENGSVRWCVAKKNTWTDDHLYLNSFVLIRYKWGQRDGFVHSIIWQKQNSPYQS